MLKAETLKTEELNQLIEVSTQISDIIAKSVKTLNNSLKSNSIK